METFSALLAICAGNSPVPGEFHTQRPVTRSFDVYFDLRPNKRLSKQSWGWWFETPSHPFWRHRNVLHLWHLWSHCTDEFYHGFHLNFEHYHRKFLSACGLWRHPGAVTTMVQTAKYDFKSIWTWCRCWFLIGWCPQSIAGMWHERHDVSSHRSLDCLPHGLFRRTACTHIKTPQHRCGLNRPITGEFP